MITVKQSEAIAPDTKMRESAINFLLGVGLFKMQLTNESKNMNKGYRKKKADAKKRFASLFIPAGLSISCIILGALYCYFLF